MDEKVVDKVMACLTVLILGVFFIILALTGAGPIIWEYLIS